MPEQVTLVDCRGQLCPTPIVTTMKALVGIESGEMLRVLADDPAFEPDIRAWSRRTGNPIVSLEQDDDTRAVAALIEKS